MICPPMFLCPLRQFPLYLFKIFNKQIVLQLLYSVTNIARPICLDEFKQLYYALPIISQKALYIADPVHSYKYSANLLLLLCGTVSKHF